MDVVNNSGTISNRLANVRAPVQSRGDLLIPLSALTNLTLVY